MTAHSFDPTTVTASIPVFDKGTYEFSAGEPKAFQRPNKDGKLTKGIRYLVICEEVIDGNQNHKGDRQFVNGYPSDKETGGINEGGLAFVKRFLIACAGYGPTAADEKAFDAAFKGEDWSLDFESGACGDMWRDATGKRFVAELDVKMSDDGSGQIQQVWKQFRKVGS